MSKAIDAGKSLLDAVLAKLPESLRDSTRAAFAAAEASDALTTLGESALARADYSRHMDDLKRQQDLLAEDYEKLNTWFADKKTALEELDRIKAEQSTDPLAPRKPSTPEFPTPGFDPKQFISRDDFVKSMNEQQMQAANYLGLQNVLTLKHFKDFGEVLDTRELLADKRLGTQKSDGGVYGLIDAYQTKFSERLTERDKQQETARIQKLVDEQVAERMKGMPNQPFPLKTAPSALDLLDAPEYKSEQFTAQAAAEEYARLQQNRQGA